MITVNGWELLSVITKHSILDIVAALDPPLQTELLQSYFRIKDIILIEVSNVSYDCPVCIKLSVKKFKL